MSNEVVGLIIIVLLFLLMFLRIPIAISMGVAAFIGIIYVKDFNTLVSAIESLVWDKSYTYSLSTIPMFILMGEMLSSSGISSELYKSFRLWFNKTKGGLAMATIGSSALFAAASGSSLANTATMGTIASKEMLAQKYDKSLVGGSIVAGGTLGVLIPPSTLFIIYGTMTEQSIGQLLIAGIIPGILLMLLYLLTIFIIVLIKPNYAPVGENSITWRDKLKALYSTIWIFIVFAIVIGGMYLGWFTPTEAAGIGAFTTFIIALIRRKLTIKSLINALLRTVNTTAFIFAIIIMAFILNYFFTVIRLPIYISNFLNGLDVPDFMIFGAIVVMYILLGMVMDALAMVVITIPITMPIIVGMDLDLIWFGVIIVLVMELGMITPPIGMNVFVLRGAVPELNLESIFKGALFFIFPILLLIILLYLYPDIALILPEKMY